MQEFWVWSLGWEDPLKNRMATHSSILARRVPWTEEPGRLQSMGLQRVGHDWVTNTFTVCIPWFPFLSGPWKLWKELFSLYECKQMTGIYIFCLSVRISADCYTRGPLWCCSWGTSTHISKTGSSNSHSGLCSCRRLGKNMAWFHFNSTAELLC